MAAKVKLMYQESLDDEICDDDYDDCSGAGDADGAGSDSPGPNLEAGITADEK